MDRMTSFDIERSGVWSEHDGEGRGLRSCLTLQRSLTGGTSCTNMFLTVCMYLSKACATPYMAALSHWQSVLSVHACMFV